MDSRIQSQLPAYRSAIIAYSQFITVPVPVSRQRIIRNLLPQLDNRHFAQIHRGAIVNLDHVRAAVRDDTGKLSLQLNGIDKTPVVSRVYRHLFQAM